MFVICFIVTVKCQALVDLSGTGEFGRHLPSHTLYTKLFDNPPPAFHFAVIIAGPRIQKMMSHFLAMWNLGMVLSILLRKRIKEK